MTDLELQEQNATIEDEYDPGLRPDADDDLERAFQEKARKQTLEDQGLTEDEKLPF